MGSSMVISTGTPIGEVVQVVGDFRNIIQCSRSSEIALVRGTRSCACGSRYHTAAFLIFGTTNSYDNCTRTPRRHVSGG